MKPSEHEIINTVKKLLADKKIDLFIGYEQGTLPLRTSPCFLVNPDDSNKLIWNSFCANNLTVYLSRIMPNGKNKKFKRIGILCKGCDSRSLTGLIREKQIKREDLYIIGISCQGIIDSRKLLPQLNSDEILSIDEDDDSIIVKLKSGEERFKRNHYLYDACLNCAYPTPGEYDMLVRTAKYAPQVSVPDPAVKEFMGKPREERWRIFEHELSKCIRCYACRNVCPNCYCKECFAEQTKPTWFGVTSERSDLLFYHLTRIFHQAGRCVDCGACVRACPMNINLRLFTRMLVDEVKERFGYEPGLSIKEQSVLAAFEIDDKQEFMTEPEKGT